MASKTLTFDIFGRDRTASKALKGVGGSVNSLNKRFGNLAGGIAAAFSVRAVVDFGKAAVASFLEAEKAQFAMQDAFDRFPAIADTNMKEIQALAKATMLKTGFDDDAITSGVATLAQYKLNGAQLKQLTPLLVDYARKTGKDVPTAAQDLGKALLGQGRSLKEVGIQFKDTGSVAGNFDQLVTSLGEKVGGVAEKFGTTDAGKIEILKTRFSEIQESIGGALLPLIEKIVPGIEENLVPAIESIIPSLSPVAEAASDFFADWLTGFGIIQRESYNFGQTIGTMMNNLIIDVAKYWVEFSVNAQNGINSVVGAINGFIGTINLLLAALGKISGTTVKLPTLTAPNVTIGPGKGSKKLTKYATGGILPATPGGVNASMGRSAGTYAEMGVPEAVIPLTDQNLQELGKGFGGGGGLTVNVHLTGMYAGDRNQLAKTVVGVVRDAVKQGHIPAGYALA